MAITRPGRRWSWRIGCIADIDLYVLATLVLTPAVFGIVMLQEFGQLRAAAAGYGHPR